MGQRKESEKIILSKEQIEELLFHRNRTATGPMALLRDSAKEKPKGLNSGMIHAWLSGRINTARLMHFEYVQKRWQSLPSFDSKGSGERPKRVMPATQKRQSTNKKIHIPKSILDELKFQKERTRVGPMALLKGRRKDYPKGLNSGMINDWLAGRTQTARPDYLKFALALWQSLPTRIN